MVSTEKDDALIERLLRIADKYKSCRLNHFSKPILPLLSAKQYLKSTCLLLEQVLWAYNQE